MTTLICILVGLGAVVLFLAAALAVLCAIAFPAIWLEDKYPKVLSLEGHPTVRGIGKGLLVTFFAFSIAAVLYVVGCDIAFDFGWIDDCPTCEVQEPAP